MDFRAIVMGLAFAFMWSSAFTSSRIIVTAAPPLIALSVRFLLSGVLAITIARMLGQSWNLSRKQWRATIIFGICQNALYLGLNFVAMQTVEASLAAIIASTMPLMVTLAGWAFLGERTSTLGVLGLLSGVLGVVIIMWSRLSAGVDITGVVMCVLGMLALTVATLSVRGATSGGNFLMVVGLQMLIGSAILTVMAAATETLTIDWSLKLVLAFIYTTLVPGVIATVVWFHLVNRIGAVKASTFHFLTPFLGVAVAAVILDEHLGMQEFIGVLIITVGILAVQLSKQTSKAALAEKTPLAEKMSAPQ